MNDYRAEVDELILEIEDYTNDYSEMAAEKLFRTCSTSWEAFKYLQDRVHDPWIPESARQQVWAVKPFFPTDAIATSRPV
jgi:ABC-type Zn uptake system ZnuABC Zn-binding protein ZnuA